MRSIAIKTSMSSSDDSSDDDEYNIFMGGYLYIGQTALHLVGVAGCGGGRFLKVSRPSKSEPVEMAMTPSRVG